LNVKCIRGVRVGSRKQLSLVGLKISPKIYVSVGRYSSESNPAIPESNSGQSQENKVPQNVYVVVRRTR
jgi:hypothetical protein